MLTRALTLCAALAAATAAQAEAAKPLKLTAADTAAVASATHRFLSASPKRSLISTVGIMRSDLEQRGKRGSSAGDGTTRYPADVTFQGGETVRSAVQHTLYLIPNGSVCTSPACWGNADQFLRDINDSDFIHLTDQYTGTDENHRHTQVLPS